LKKNRYKSVQPHNKKQKVIYDIDNTPANQRFHNFLPHIASSETLHKSPLAEVEPFSGTKVYKKKQQYLKNLNQSSAFSNNVNNNDDIVDIYHDKKEKSRKTRLVSPKLIEFQSIYSTNRYSQNIRNNNNTIIGNMYNAMVEANNRNIQLPNPICERNSSLSHSPLRTM